MARLFGLVLILFGCTASPDDDRCVFDGRYDFGFRATNGCDSVSESISFFDEEGPVRDDYRRNCQ